MKYIVAANEMKEYDRYTIENLGVPSLVLMERAALSVFEEIVNIFPESAGKIAQTYSALIAVGSGNNGADGLALARMLLENNWNVEVITVDGGRRTEEYLKQQGILNRYGTSVGSKAKNEEYTIVVDAVFGVGLSREVCGQYQELLDNLNTLKGCKISIDIPSGIHSDTGKIMGTAFRSDLTVTFGYLKRGHLLCDGRIYSGKVLVKDIGISKLALEVLKPSMYYYSEDICELLPKRSATGNKGTFGKVLLIAGFDNMAGAAVLAAKASYQSGTGMVKVISALQNREILLSNVPEVLFGTTDELKAALKWCDVITIGPGLGTSVQAKTVLQEVLQNSTKPIILDADAINLVAGDEGMFFLLSQRNKKAVCIMTPHVGEMSRLAKVPVNAIKDDVVSVTEKMAGELQCTIVCKDYVTVVAHNKEKLFYLNRSGNCGMATAGSGDVLTGIIAGLLAQGLPAQNAATVGVYLHGLAGDLAKNRKNEYSMMAGDIVNCISDLLV